MLLTLRSMPSSMSGPPHGSPRMGNVSLRCTNPSTVSMRMPPWGGEIEGAEGIARMVGDLTFWIDFTGSEAISVDYTDNGAVVQWVWEGMVVTGADYGEHFSMRAQTTFEIEDGLITRSADDYVLTDAPWG